jgi:hypothetical protein
MHRAGEKLFIDFSGGLVLRRNATPLVIGIVVGLPPGEVAAHGGAAVQDGPGGRAPQLDAHGEARAAPEGA